MVDLTVFTSAKKFFGEWDDSKKLFPPIFLLSVLMLVVLFWIKVSIPTIAYQADIFQGFLLFAMLVAIIDHLKENNDLVGYLSIGKNLSVLIPAIIGGIILAFVFNANKFAVISTPLTSVQVSASVASFFFVVIVAPFVEENFFRMSLYPSIIASLKNSLGEFRAGIIAMLFVSAAFAFFHFAVFNAGVTAMIAAFIFSMIAISGNRLFESSWFGFALHITSNTIVIGGISTLLAIMH